MCIEETCRKKIKGEQTKQKLLETATELFGRYDFDSITVDSIVEAAGVAKGTFYIYFESKDALIATLLSNYIGNIDADYKAHIDSLPSGTTATAMILSLVEKIADVLTATIGIHRMKIVYKVMLTEIINMDDVKGYNRKLYHIFEEVIEQGINQREFNTKLTTDILTKHFVMAIRGISFEWCIRYPDFDLKEQALEHFRILLNGIREVR